MELTEFAERILLGRAMADKLVDPGALTDAAPRGLARFPDEPLRPEGLALARKGEHGRARFPTEKELARDEERGLVLHFFANHELLALELMALALLRFADAPPSFRMGLAATMREEQKHMRLYLARMSALGVGFGAAPVSRYFWDAVSGTPSPLAFVAQMSLTLEQANLDFSLHYRDLFARLGDAETAGILDVVYREEIGHVKHGLVWFDRWRDPQASQWDAYLAVLPPPLTPSRAKGLGFAEEARASAGLAPEFIEELKAHKQSKGTPPAVFWLNPSCEDEIAHGRTQYNAPKPLADLRADLAGLLALLARPIDVVLVDELPTKAHAARMEAAGYALPQFLREEQLPDAVPGKLAERFEPWGKSPVAAAKARKLGLTWQRPLAMPREAAVFAKSWSAALHRELSPETARSEVCRSEDAVTAALARMPDAVIKAPLGSSGRHMQRVLAGELRPDQRAWLTRTLADQGEVVVEPWLDKAADLSVQVVVDERGGVKVLGVTRFLTDPRGRYVGHLLGRKYDDLGEGVRALYEGKLLERLEETGARVGEALARAGYEGPAGIDALLFRDPSKPGGLALRPIVEVNPRYTMGRVALALEKRIGAGVRAQWLHLSAKQARELDVGALATRHPVVLKKEQIVAGVLPTNDPSQARVMQTLLVAGEDALAAIRL